jgi:hypothetical protein
MDSDRFDGLVRTFGQIRSRRQTLRGLAGAAAAGALTLRGRQASARSCKTETRPCKRTSECCSGLRCRAEFNGRHNTTTVCKPFVACTAGQDYCVTAGDTCGECGGSGRCATTVGGAVFCGQSGNCFDCDSDAACAAQFGTLWPICIRMGCCPTGTGCVAAC